jgi:predicted PurR-regulated permease PerM
LLTQHVQKGLLIMPDPSPPPSRLATLIAPAASAAPALQVGVVVIAALYLGREVLIPITLAILLSFLLAPIVELLGRAKLGRVPAVLLAVIMALGVMTGFGSVIGSQLAQLAGNIPQYSVTIEQKVDTVRAYTIGRLDRFVGSLGHQVEPLGISRTPAGAHPLAGSSPAGATPQSAPAAAATPGDSLLALAERYLSTALLPLATVGIVFVVAIFILLQREDLRDRLIRLFGATDLHRTTSAMDDAARRLSKYFLTQFGINATFGLVIGVGLYFIGVPNPVLWGMLSALLRFVPYIGSFIAAGLPIALAAAVDPGWSMALWTAALYIVIELLVGQAIEPMMYGRGTGLSPLAVVVAAIFWSWLWGPIGLILSMPLTLCLVVLGRHVERLEFLEVLLGDRPALTPVESFYQRILAGDADEAQDHAELLLKDRSLSWYYDEVALRGLQLAAEDAQRGVLHGEQLERVKNTIKELVSRRTMIGNPHRKSPMTRRPRRRMTRATCRRCHRRKAPRGSTRRSRPYCDRRPQSSAWPARGRWTRRRQPCSPSCSASTGLVRAQLRMRHPRAKRSPRLTCLRLPWSASPTSTSPALRPTCAISFGG